MKILSPHEIFFSVFSYPNYTFMNYSQFSDLQMAEGVRGNNTVKTIEPQVVCRGLVPSYHPDLTADR